MKWPLSFWLLIGFLALGILITIVVSIPKAEPPNNVGGATSITPIGEPPLSTTDIQPPTDADACWPPDDSIPCP
ncbi:hypothetical protein HYW32_03175 [Candidatus Berkelbacteria bacterium]|nr:hypothetical protein [Candidatus Berkelbacteria bacterium]